MTTLNEKNIIKFLSDLESKDYLIETDWAGLEINAPWLDIKEGVDNTQAITLERAVFDSFNYYRQINLELAGQILEKAIKIDLKQHKNASLIKWRQKHIFNFGELFLQDLDDSVIKNKFDILFKLPRDYSAYIICNKNVFSKGQVLQYRALAKAIDGANKEEINFISMLDKAMLDEIVKHYNEKRQGEKYDFKAHYAKDALILQEARKTMFLREQFLLSISLGDEEQLNRLIKENVNYFKNDLFILHSLTLCSKTGNVKLISNISKHYGLMGEVNTQLYFGSFAHDFLSIDGVLPDILEHVSIEQKEHLLNIFYLPLYDLLLFNRALYESASLEPDFFKDIANYKLNVKTRASDFEKESTIAQAVLSNFYFRDDSEYLNYLIKNLPRNFVLKDLMDNKIMFSVLLNKEKKVPLDGVKNLLELFPELIETQGVVDNTIMPQLKSYSYEHSRLMDLPLKLSGAVMVAIQEEAAEYIERNFKLNYNELANFYKERNSYGPRVVGDNVDLINFMSLFFKNGIRFNAIEMALEGRAQVSSVFDLMKAFLDVEFKKPSGVVSQKDRVDLFIKLIGVIMNLKNSPLSQELVKIIDEYETSYPTMVFGIAQIFKILGIKKDDEAYSAISANITRHHLNNAIRQGVDTESKFKL